MATKNTTTRTKKTTKPAAKTARTSTAKKSAKAPVKRAANTRKTAARKKPTKSQSFRLEKNDQPFMTFNPNLQTLYWIILGIIVIAFTAWIMKLQADISSIYDQIDANESAVIDQPRIQRN